MPEQERHIGFRYCSSLFLLTGCLLSSLQKHEDICQYGDEQCQACGESVERRHLDQHRTKECINRAVACTYCGGEVLQSNMEVRNTWASPLLHPTKNIFWDFADHTTYWPYKRSIEYLLREDVQVNLYMHSGSGHRERHKMNTTSLSILCFCCCCCLRLDWSDLGMECNLISKYPIILASVAVLCITP